MSRGYETLKDWLDDHPRDTEIRAVLASVYLEDKHSKKATVEYERILEDEPEHLRALQNLTWLYSEKDEPRAREFAEYAYRLFPDDPYVMDAYDLAAPAKRFSGTGAAFDWKGAVADS